MSPSVLIVEDDPVTREMLSSYFGEEGFDVYTSESVAACDSYIDQSAVDICLVDIKLPGKDGLTWTKEVRRRSDVGIILLTGKDELVDRVVGLESGADDYVTKPFEPRELLSRVKNILRRTRKKAPEETDSDWLFDGWKFSEASKQITDPDGRTTVLSDGEHRLLKTFVENPMTVMTRDKLMGIVKSREWHPEDRYVDILVVKLRRIFQSGKNKASFIRTVHGKGYLFETTPQRIPRNAF